MAFQIEGDPGPAFHDKKIIYAQGVHTLDRNNSDIRQSLGRFVITSPTEEDHEIIFQRLHQSSIRTPFGKRAMTVTKNFGQRSKLRAAIS